MTVEPLGGITITAREIYDASWNRAHATMRWPRRCANTPGPDGLPILEVPAMGDRTCIADGCDRNAKTRGLCQKHYLAAWRGNGPTPLPKRTSADRFWAAVDRAEHGCWPWKGSQRRGGYGRVRIAGRDFAAHRVAYEMEIGAIPEGLELDHLCRNRLCVRPSHLEPVTGQVNTLRGETLAAENAAKQRCIHGHEFTPENTYWRGTGHRTCRTCQRDAMRRKRAVLRATS